MTVPSHHAGPSSASAAPLITPMIRLSDWPAAASTAAVQASPRWVRSVGVQRAPQRLVMRWQHTVFAVIAAELGEKRHRLGSALLPAVRRKPSAVPGRKRLAGRPFRAETDRVPKRREQTSGCRTGGRVQPLPARPGRKASRNTRNASRSSRLTEPDSKLAAPCPGQPCWTVFDVPALATFGEPQWYVTTLPRPDALTASVLSTVT